MAILTAEDENIFEEKHALEEELKELKERAIESIVTKEKTILELIEQCEEKDQKFEERTRALQEEVRRAGEASVGTEQIRDLERENGVLKREVERLDSRLQMLRDEMQSEKEQSEVEYAALCERYEKDTEYFKLKLEKSTTKLQEEQSEGRRLAHRLTLLQNSKEE